MFATLNDKLSSVFKRLRGEVRLSEDNIKEAIKQVRMALLEADVNFKVVKKFIAGVQEKAIGEAVLKSLSPAQVFIKIVNDELVSVLGGKDYNAKINLVPNPPTVIMLCGLQGSGKTTTAGKLANFFQKQGKSVMLVAADIYRPAAIDQLEVLAKKLKTSIHTDRVSKDAVKIAKDGLAAGKLAAKDLVIIDTAGRLHIDEELMTEIVDVKDAVKPHEILFVADAMTGQDAVTVAAEFNNKLEVTGVVLTKMDGDARGGAALSIKEVTGKPLKFVGMGEKLDEFEQFYPDRMASRILGMGDIVTLVEKAQEAIDEKDAEELAGKFGKEGLDFNDMLKQFKMIKKMGSFDSIMKMIPGLSGLGNINIEDDKIKRIEAVILSMTPQERRSPKLLNGSRKKRIARGCGQTVQDVNKLVNQLSQMNKMMKTFGKKGGKGMLPGKIDPKMLKDMFPMK